MAELIKTWIDGGILSVSYGGDRDGSAVFSSDIAEGLDRETTVLIIDETRTVSVELSVKQSGMREEFVASDGDFLLSDGGTFNVLKNEL